MPSPSKAELRRRVGFAVVFVVGLAAGCIKSSSTDGSDGSSCEKSSDCKSKTCAEGTCAGRSCDGEDAGECDPGWVCAGGSSGTIGDVINGSNSGPSCSPTCGVCPPSTHCPAFATNATGSAISADAGILCSRGPQRVATIAGPDTVVAGSTVTYTVTFAPAQTFEVYEWYYGLADSSALDDVTSSTGTHDNVLVFQPRGSPLGESDAVVGVSAVDVNTSYDARLMTGEGSRKIHVTCTPPGGDCSAYGSCCGGGTRCDYSASAGTCK